MEYWGGEGGVDCAHPMPNERAPSTSARADHGAPSSSKDPNLADRPFPGRWQVQQALLLSTGTSGLLCTISGAKSLLSLRRFFKVVNAIPILELRGRRLRVFR